MEQRLHEGKKKFSMLRALHLKAACLFQPLYDGDCNIIASTSGLLDITTNTKNYILYIILDQHWDSKDQLAVMSNLLLHCRHYSTNPAEQCVSPPCFLHWFKKCVLSFYLVFADGILYSEVLLLVRDLSSLCFWRQQHQGWQGIISRSETNRWRLPHPTLTVWPDPLMFVPILESNSQLY